MPRKKKEDAAAAEKEVRFVELDLLADAAGKDGYKREEMTQESPVEKRNVLAEIMDALFGNPAYIENMTPQQATQNLFMVLRRIAIQYPTQANMFNDGKCNAKDVLLFFSSYFYNPSGNKPRWIYASGAKKEQEKKDIKATITKADIRDYVDHEEISMKDFDSALRLFPEETVNDVKEHVAYFKKIQSSKI